VEKRREKEEKQRKEKRRVQPKKKSGIANKTKE
jgi:hypothetical protein